MTRLTAGSLIDSDTPGCFIAGQWAGGAGEVVTDRDPTDGDVLWQGRGATADQVDAAVGSAKAAFSSWRRTPYAERHAILVRYAEILQRDKAALAALIARETGKPRWECAAEMGAMIGKVKVTDKAWEARCSQRWITPGVADVVGVRRVKAHGPVVVFGPFNLPGHLPNGHMVPALLAGNTVILKPSEQTPAFGIAMVQRLLEAGLPAGCIQLVQGAKLTGIALTAHPDIRGLYFTGSSHVGQLIHRALAGRTEVVCALEMGGNNPLVLWPLPDWHQEDIEASALHVALSAYITGGQRCTCARRLIIPAGDKGDRLLDAIVRRIAQIKVDRWDADEQPLYGPLISERAADDTLAAWQSLIDLGGQPLVTPRRLPDLSPAAVSPGLVDLTGVPNVPDEEVFGPILRVFRADDWDHALALANATDYGLSAALIGGTRKNFEQFWNEIDAGICNWNRATTGALSSLPFGGTGLSGNHHPAGWTSVDYCVWPVASTERPAVAKPASLPPGVGPH
ncbi:MAG: succinylglutamate-semialdehyde dehydrogenase [Myxococcales bacterium]|nr:succinylglutamate-semialdehyde dehydrogenase [Myxococcales bacterium]